jgi:threonine/homoserine/homoserine lactone efflux protein
MFDSLFWAFVGLAVLVTITPGADTVLTIRNTLTGGTRDGIWTVAGICSDFIFQPLLAALGVAALFIKLPLAFTAVKFAGALYLVYLGGQSLREAARLWKARYGEVPVGARTNSDSWKRYREGLLTNALIPKSPSSTSLSCHSSSKPEIPSCLNRYSRLGVITLWARLG